jgi:hypothetical protein
MGGDGSKKDRNDGSDQNAVNAEMQYRAIAPFMGASQGLLANQLSRGGYGDVQGILSSTYQPMNMGYVTDPNSGNQLYSGAAYMSALRGGLDAQGIKAPTSDDKDKRDR